jgi:hypothetical protein
VNTYGYCLTCADQDYPPLTGGMTVAGWFDPVQAGNANLGYTATSASPCVFTLAAACTYSVGELVTLVPDIGFSPPGGFTANGLYYVSVVSGSTFQLAATSGGGSLGSTSTGAGFVQPVTGQAVSNYILMRGAGSATGPAFELYLANAYNFDQGQLYLTVWDKVTRAATTTNVNSNNWLGGALSHFALLITATTWQVIIDGGAFAGASGTCNLPSSIQWLSCMGAADRYATGQMMCGDACQVAVFPALLTADQVTQIALAGYPLAIDGEFGTEGPASRIERLAAYGGWAGPRAISTQSRTGMAGITDIQGTAGSVAADGVVTAATGQQANQAVTNIVTSDGGWMYADGNGVLCYLSRGDVYGLGPAWLLGEHAGEYPYSIDAVLGYDKQLLYNQAQLTQSTGTGTPVTSSNVPSETQHGVATYTQTVYQDDIGVVGDMANWIVNTRSTPAERAESLTVNAANNAANWPFVLGVEPAQPVQVARRPILASGPTVVQAIVAQVKRSIDFAAGTATVTIVTDAFPEGTVLTAGDPVLGLLNGENLLGW